jgi:hypothetical protein
MTNTSNFDFPLLYSNQSQKEVTINEAITDIDRVLQMNVLDHALTAPPVSLTIGSKYIVGVSATGDWLGHDTEIALYDGVWTFLTPKTGWTAYSVAGDALYVFTGAAWVSLLDVIGATQGSILYRNAAGWVTLTPGTAAQALLSGGAGANPAWGDVAAGVTSVDVAGGTTGLAFTGGPVTSTGTITASGTLVVANGGTGATTAAGARSALGIDNLTSQAVSTTGTSLSINAAAGGHVRLALGHNISVAFAVTNWPASGTLGRLMLEITNGGANNITVWPGTTIWAGGAAPTITSGNGKKDTIVLTSTDGGTNFRGYVVAQNMA